MMTKLTIPFLAVLLLGVVLFSHAAEEERLKPYILAKSISGDMAMTVAEIKAQLTQAGFLVLGSYEPYKNATVIAFTSDEIRAECANTENGGFAAALRVSITVVEDEIQIAYNNPRYLANAYRLNDDLAAITSQLSLTLGEEEAFGSEKGLTVKKLRDYKYVPGGFIPMPMPKFDDVDELAEFASHEEAVQVIDAGLTDNESVSLVYKVVIPGSDAVLYGVGIHDGDGADETVMGTTDQEELKATPHLPYELLVTGNKAIALRGKFRIAQSFPDLSMGTFMKIRNAPGAIEKTLQAVAVSD